MCIRPVTFKLKGKYVDMFDVYARAYGNMKPLIFFQLMLDKEFAARPALRDNLRRMNSPGPVTDESDEMAMDDLAIAAFEDRLESGVVAHVDYLRRWSEMPLAERMAPEILNLTAIVALGVRLSAREDVGNMRNDKIYAMLCQACGAMGIPLDGEPVKTRSNAPCKHSKIEDELDAILSGDTPPAPAPAPAPAPDAVADSNALEKAKADIAAGNMRNKPILVEWAGNISHYRNDEGYLKQIARDTLGYIRVEKNGRKEILQKLLELACMHMDIELNPTTLEEENAAEYAAMSDKDKELADLLR